MNGRKGPLILGVHLTTRGIAYTLFESPLSPVDWGVKHSRGRRTNRHVLKMLVALLDRLQPDVLVIEEFSAPPKRKTSRVRRLSRLLTTYANGNAIELHRASRTQVLACFASTGAKNRYEIAHVIASLIHEFGHRLPSIRKLWTREDAQLGIFDAASFVMTYYSQIGGSPLAEDRPQGP